jgi:hypothetical protein
MEKNVSRFIIAWMMLVIIIMSGLITRYYLNYKIKDEVEVIEETISPLNVNEMFV